MRVERGQGSPDVVWMAGAGINGHGAALPQLVRGWATAGGKGGHGGVGGGHMDFIRTNSHGATLSHLVRGWEGRQGKGWGSADVVWMAGAGVNGHGAALSQLVGA